MHPIAARIWRTIRRHDLIPPDSRVIAAVSGGSDSLSLVLLLAELQSTGGFTLAGLAHFNHQLRGSESDADETFCRDVATELALPWIRGSADVAGLAREAGRSIEDAGRRARYTFLDEAARDLGAHRIAVGHTLNDQAETFLLRLIRGAGPRGLAAIHPRVGRVVRPLLEVGREDLRAYLSEQGRAFREDAGNLDVVVPRNRVRHELLPLLQQRFSPGVIDVLAREAAIARDDSAYLDDRAAEAADRLARREDSRFTVDASALSACPPAIATRVVHAMLAGLAPDRFAGYDHVERVLGLAASVRDGRVDLPGVLAERSGAWLVLRSRARTRRDGPPVGNPFRYSLSIPGEAFCNEAGCVIAAREDGLPAAAAREGLIGRGGTAMIDAASLSGSLAVRNRRAGDAFRPLGLGGRKKLQDFFVDRKIPRAERDRIPLVVDSHDRIVWVAGHALGDEFRVTDRTGAVVILTLRELGGSA